MHHPAIHLFVLLTAGLISFEFLTGVGVAAILIFKENLVMEITIMG